MTSNRPEPVPIVRSVVIDSEVIERLAATGCGLVIRPYTDGDGFMIRVEVTRGDEAAPSAPLPARCTLRAFDSGSSDHIPVCK